MHGLMSYAWRLLYVRSEKERANREYKEIREI